MLACIRKAAFVIAQGGPHSIQRAARALSAAPLAPLHAGTVTKLREQHPTASEPMGDLPVDGDASAMQRAALVKALRLAAWAEVIRHT